MDVEKNAARPAATDADVSRGQTTRGHIEPHEKLYTQTIWQRFGRWGVELRGITPVPVEDRTDGRFINVFTVWFTMSVNILAIITGMAGTLIFGLPLLPASLTILFFSLLCTLPPAFLSTLGPRTGLRQMIQARYSFGLYGGMVPVLLNLATMTGFVVISCVLGGQTLAAINGDVSWNVGIVIVALVALLLSAFGYRVLHQYERYSWAWALFAIVVMTGYGGKRLGDKSVLYEAPVLSSSDTAKLVMDFGSLVAGYLITWGGMASDISTYIRRDAPPARIFAYTYVGLWLPTVLLMCLGAAIGSAVPNIPSWQAASEVNSSGGVFGEMLAPAGGFGKFILVLLALSILGNVAATLYAITINLQILLPTVLVRYVPRFVFSLVMVAVVIPVSIKAATDFFGSLENFLGLIGYWAAAFVAVVILEHLYFRRGDADSYRHEIWDLPKQLPTGWPALAATFIACAALVVPSMAQVWWVGPIGAKTGDIGFEMAFAASGLLYLLFRSIDLKFLHGRL